MNDSHDGVIKLECPRCEKIWTWDACQDVYVDLRTYAKTVRVEVKEISDVEEIEYHICSCGKIIAIAVKDSDGEGLFEQSMKEL